MTTNCQHKTNVTQQAFDVFGKKIRITFCHDCTEIVEAVDEKGEPWTMPRTKQEISTRLQNVAAGVLERFAKRLRGSGS